MLLKLGLPKGKVIWALVHPIAKEYIHEMDGIGYQQCRLIITESQQPVQVELESYPKWAQSMIISSLNMGELINTGDPIVQPKQETSKTLEVIEPTKPGPKRGPGRGRKLSKVE